MHALAHGELTTALGLNLLLVLSLVPLAVIWVRWARRSWRGLPRTSMAHPAALWGLVALVVVFGVARNLPGGQVLAP